jgi:hypothetical protein
MIALLGGQANKKRNHPRSPDGAAGMGAKPQQKKG